MPPQIRAITNNSTRYQNLILKSNVYLSGPTLRKFSVCVQHQTRLRRSMWTWFETQGRNFHGPLPGSTNYLGAYDARGRLKRLGNKMGEDGSDGPRSRSTGKDMDEPLPAESNADLMPFPQNRAFRSQPVVNEEMREAIWEKIVKDGQSVTAVSAELGVEMSRVGAIVRLKEIEKEWIRTGKRFAKPYAKAVLAMLPQTPYPYDSSSRTPQAHESINDLPVHAATKQQIFHPTSESREFTRADAAKVFDESLLPADKRVPHPELAELERDRLAGMPYAQRVAKATQRNNEAQQKKLLTEQRRREKESMAVKIVSGSRWDFKFREISVDDAGVEGRGHNGTGWRYGVPHMDRRKGEVKIPTRVA